MSCLYWVSSIFLSLAVFVSSAWSQTGSQSQPDIRIGLPPPVSVNLFTLFTDEKPALRLRMEQHLTQPTPPLFIPQKVSDVVAGIDQAYQSLSWQSAPADRNDHFSVRWKGSWQPGPGEYEFRLRADDKARFVLDGQELLSCSVCPVGVTRTLTLDPRVYDLQVDYVEQTGDAYVFLEYRQSGQSWKEIPAFRRDGKQQLEGWQVQYFSDEEFRCLEYEEVDLSLTHAWARESPFQRAEDIPQLTFKWMTEDGKVAGQITSNRDGALLLSVEPLQEGGLASLKYLTPTSLRLSADGFALDLVFDQILASGIPTDPLTQVSIPVRKNKPLRFWQEGWQGATGSLIQQKLTSQEKKLHNQRPRLEGDLSGLDRSLLVQGRGWCRMIFESLASPEANQPRLKPVKSSTHLPTISTELPPAVAWILGVCAPDLNSRYADRLKTLPEGWADSLFSGCEERDLKNLAALLLRWKQAQSQPISDLKTVTSTRFTHRNPTNVGFQLNNLATGLTATIEAALVLRSFIQLNEEGQPVIRNNVGSQEVNLVNWWLGGKVFDLSLSENFFQLQQKENFFVRVRAPLILQNLEFDPRGDCLLVLQVIEEAPLEVGPLNRIRGVHEDQNPLLLVNRQGVLVSPKLVPGLHSYRVVLQEESGIPRR